MLTDNPKSYYFNTSGEFQVGEVCKRETSLKRLCMENNIGASMLTYSEPLLANSYLDLACFN